MTKKSTDTTVDLNKFEEDLAHSGIGAKYLKKVGNSKNIVLIVDDDKLPSAAIISALGLKKDNIKPSKDGGIHVSATVLGTKLLGCPNKILEIIKQIRVTQKA